MSDISVSTHPRRPWGIAGLSIFFAVGALVSLASIASILFPGSPLDAAWHHHVRAQTMSSNLGPWAAVLMLLVFIVCSLAAAGLWLGASWGRWLAIGILLMNGLIDLLHAVAEKDLAVAIGLPIAATLLVYLLSSEVQEFFSLEPHYL